MNPQHAIACEECRSLLGGYALAALEPDEMEAVRTHVATCAGCSREHAQLAPVPSLLDAAGSADAIPEKPPAALEDAVLDRFARERRPPDDAPSPARRPPRVRDWLTRPLPVAAGAATLAVLATLVVTAGLGGSGSTRAHAYGALLRGSAAAPGAHAYARLSTQSAGTRVDLRVHGMEPVPGAVYELWCVGHDGTRVSAGTFRVDDAGGATVRLTTAARLGEYDRLSVERRLGGGGAGRRVMTGSIEY